MKRLKISGEQLDAWVGKHPLKGFLVYFLVVFLLGFLGILLIDFGIGFLRQPAFTLALLESPELGSYILTHAVCTLVCSAVIVFSVVWRGREKYLKNQKDSNADNVLP